MRDLPVSRLSVITFIAVLGFFYFQSHTNAFSKSRNMAPAIKFNLLTADLKTIQTLLQQRQVTSRSLVTSYLGQIRKHDADLHAMIQVAPSELLLKRADELDREREDGSLRGPLHGVPIIVKDSIATHPDLGLNTSAGSLALATSRTRKNSKVVELLIAAGAIILGKTNLSEFSNAKGSVMRSGWSAAGGQTMSAYVDQNMVDPDDGKDGHSNPSGSSSGSAVGVSAGYSPVAIGAETDGSLICPSGRAALYAIKPSIGLVSQDGMVPISSLFDSAGPMAKTVHDLAVVLDVISERDSSHSFVSALGGRMEDFAVATLDPLVWKFPDSFIKPVPEASEQILHDIFDAYNTIKSKAKRFAANVPLSTTDKFQLNGQNSKLVIMRQDTHKELNQYLEDLEESDVRSIKDIIEFNKEHAKKELPDHHPRQDLLIEAEESRMSEEDYREHVTHLRRVCRDDGIDFILQKYGVDVIIGPADSAITSLATGSGYPVAAMPLSYLTFNGRPLGLAALAGKNQDATLIKFLSAWEATFPPRKPPPSLSE
ncbi:putative glutamyl-tRNA amidotransferase subunit A [Xylariaceae sp. FL0255]|nr:putative glutamyl-tRNA amidotransferase subunit A [Xylariaceae sp. FL0255]